MSTLDIFMPLYKESSEGFQWSYIKSESYKTNVTLCTRVQELERMQGCKSKDVLHKNHRKRELDVLFLFRLYLYYLLVLQVITIYKL